MAGDQPISWLMFITLAAGVLIASGAFLYFLRSQRNRDAASHALVESKDTGHVAPHGAFPEIGGVAAVLVIAMGLLAAGYLQRSDYERRQTTSQTGGTGMAQSVGTSNTPKPYQPANPAPDTRGAPTSSDTGTGPANGSTGNPK
jgi:hypothetical protein